MARFIHTIVVYETHSRFILIGTDLNEEHYHVLKIDRTLGNDLQLIDDAHVYTRTEIDTLLHMIAQGNLAKKAEKTAGFVERARSLGVLGFVRFLEGFYLVLITRAVEVARVGFASVLEIKDTLMLPVSNEAHANAEEGRYLRLFQSIDLANNFYFTHAYDLSRTLQENVHAECVGEEKKYVWNDFLLTPLREAKIDSRWRLPIVHGYVRACTLNACSCSLSLVLIARRSSRFAGPRFLKRGANFDGDVANEVETEQICFDNAISSFEKGRFTSFVQMRGSVPLIWSQDLAKVMPKPPIQVDLADPFATVPARHFGALQCKFGHPVIALNLVKRRETAMREGLLNDEYRPLIAYLNQFADPDDAILYLSFDMARAHKSGVVLDKLNEIGQNIVRLTGWFQSFPPLFCHTLRPLLANAMVPQKVRGEMAVQSGVARTNCVDCTDRTNTAQFAIGRVAFAYQLYSLALLEKPELSLDAECCRVLESLYEEHGDTLATQYAGSNLTHGVRSYTSRAASSAVAGHGGGKTTKGGGGGLQARSRDFIQSVSRYYSNTFSDAEKQQAINLFLGVFRPAVSTTAIWDLPTDVYLHNRGVFPSIESEESVANHVTETKVGPDFDLHYRPHELSSFDAMLSAAAKSTKTMQSLTSPSVEGGIVNFLRYWRRGTPSPRVAEDDRIEDAVAATPAGGETAPSSGDEEGSSSETDMLFIQLPPKPTSMTTSVAPKAQQVSSSVRFSSLFPSMLETYGVDTHAPAPASVQLYADFAMLSRRSDDVADFARLLIIRDEAVNEKRFASTPVSVFDGRESSYGVRVPKVSAESIRRYKEAVAVAKSGPRTPSERDVKRYEEYVCARAQKDDGAAPTQSA